ncbi:MAG: hypothetical protein JNG85_04125, partial [Spirochaetaceae bacterium]|nr:hypothetical protein [Spirochaetaceae bacterium]
MRSIPGALFALFALPVAAQERIALGLPEAGSRLDLMRRLGDLAREFLSPQAGTRGVAALAAVGLVYGFIHALGPGHQKSLVAGTILAEGGGRRGAVAAAAVAAGSHAAAVILFGLACLVLERAAGSGGASFGGKRELWLGIAEKLSAVALLALAARSLFRRCLRALKTTKPTEDGAAACHCGCGHSGNHAAECHAPKEHPGGLGGTSLATIAAGSLAPCPGALLFMLAGLSAGNPAAGMVGVIAMSG